jgi:hypothetical protein
LDARLARRLISLELADVSIPPPDGMTPEAAPLYFRVLIGPAETLRVELWELGRSRGARSVSSHGTPHLRARRIALAAAELARLVVFRRQADARAAEAAAEEAAKRQAEARGFPVYASFVVAPGAQVGWIGLGDLWLAGPNLGVGLRMSNHFNLELKGGLLAGGVSKIPGSAAARFIDATLSPSYTFLADNPVAIETGVSATVSAVHFSDVLAVDDTPSELDTWSARALASVAIVPRLSESLRLRVGPDAGFLLRRLVVTDANNQRHRLGGLFLGLSASVLIEPWRSEVPHVSGTPGSR